MKFKLKTHTQQNDIHCAVYTPTWKDYNGEGLERLGRQIA